MLQIRGLGTARLGTYGDSPTIAGQGPDRRAERRSSRSVVKVWQRGVTQSVSSRLCFLAAGPLVRVDISTELVAHVSGVHHCGSPWACPICAPVIRERRAQEVDLALSGHLATGGVGLFVTQTVRHDRRDRLEPRLALMAGALNATLQGRAWQRFKRSLGFIGAIRVVESTYGVHGWHPHCHSAFVLEGAVEYGDLLDFSAWLFARWESVCVRAGFGTLERAYGVDVRPVTSGDGLGSYLAKVEGGWGIGQELARGDVKKAAAGVSPFELLLRAAGGDLQAGYLWREYELATFGKRFLRWSPGLRERLLPEVEEVSDVEAAAAEGIGLVLVSVWFRGQVWDLYAVDGSTGELLAELERAAADGDLPDVVERWGGMCESDLKELDDVWQVRSDRRKRVDYGKQC